MGHTYQVAFEVRAPSDDSLDHALHRTWRSIERQDDLLLDYVLAGELPKLRAELGAFLKAADRGHDDGSVLRYFSPYYEKTPLTETVLVLFQDILFPSEDGFSGTYRIVPGSLGDESGEMDYAYWGDDDRIVDAIFYDVVLLPQWLHFGVHINHYDLGNLVGRNLMDSEVRALSEAVMPKLQQLIRDEAVAMGLVRIMDEYEETGDDDSLVFTVDQELAPEEPWPEPASCVKEVRRREAAFAAARLLVNAYDRGEENVGSIDWNDLDHAYEVALKAVRGGRR